MLARAALDIAMPPRLVARSLVFLAATALPAAVPALVRPYFLVMLLIALVPLPCLKA